MKRAFVAFNNNRPPNDIANYKAPEYFPCFIKVAYKDEADEILIFNTLTLPVLECMMDGHSNCN